MTPLLAGIHNNANNFEATKLPIWHLPDMAYCIEEGLELRLPSMMNHESLMVTLLAEVPT